MEEIVAVHIDDDKREEVLCQSRMILDILNKYNFCHGDFRAPNILVRADDRVIVIDFQWSGVKGVVYPAFMNHAEIEWPKGAEDGKAIMSEHNRHWLHLLESNYDQITYMTSETPFF